MSSWRDRDRDLDLERDFERVSDRFGVLLSPRLFERRGDRLFDFDRLCPFRDTRESRVRDRRERERERDRLRDRVPVRERVR